MLDALPGLLESRPAAAAALPPLIADPALRSRAAALWEAWADDAGPAAVPVAAAVLDGPAAADPPVRDRAVALLVDHGTAADVGRLDALIDATDDRATARALRQARLKLVRRLRAAGEDGE